MNTILLLAALIAGADEDLSVEELRNEILSVQAQTDQYIADNDELESRIYELETRLSDLQLEITESEVLERTEAGGSTEEDDTADGNF